MKNKIIISLLVILCLFSTVAFAASTTFDMTIDNAEVEAGATGVVLNFTVTNNPGLAGLEFGFVLPEGITATDYGSAPDGFGFEGESLIWSNRDSCYKYVSYNDVNMTNTGLIASITVSVDASVAPGEYPITFTFVDPFNEDFDTVDHVFTGGVITVKDNTPPVVPSTTFDMTIDNAEVEAGATGVVLNFNVTNNPGLAGLEFGFVLPEGITATDYGSAPDGFGFEGESLIWSNRDSCYKYVSYNDVNMTNTGLLASITVSVDASVAPGEYPITFTFVDPFNEDFDTVDHVFTGGVITVKGGTTPEPCVNTPKTLLNAHTLRTYKPTGLRFQAEISSAHTASKIGWIVTTDKQMAKVNMTDYNTFTLDSTCKMVGKDTPYYSYNAEDGTDLTFSSDGNIDILSAVLTGINAANYETVIVARPYSIDDCGTIHYGDVYANSVKAVAQVMDGDTSLTAEQQAVITAILAGQEFATPEE